MEKKSILIFSIILLSLNFTHAIDFTGGGQFDFPTNNIGDLDDVFITNASQSQVLLFNQSSNIWFNSGINNSLSNVNASEFWITDIGNLGTVNTTQFENNGGTLSIILSWLEGVIISVGDINWLALDGSNSPTASIDWGAQNLTNVENLLINNDAFIGGTLEIDEFLLVGIDLNETNIIVNPGDAAFGGNVIIANASVTAFAGQWGFSAAFFDNGADDETEFFFTFSATFDTSNGLFCDTLNTPFTTNSTDKLITSVFSAELGTQQIPIPINIFLNSTCVIVDILIFGDDVRPNLTSVAYAVSPQPTFAVSDNGLVINGVKLFFDRDRESINFGSYQRKNTLQNKPGGNLFADLFFNTDNELEFISGTQAGVNNSGSFFRGDMGFFSTRNYNVTQKQNLTFLHDLAQRWEFINITPRLNYFSELTGADVAIENGLETQRLFTHDANGIGLATFEGDTNILLRNTDTTFDVAGGAIHVRQERIEQIGVSPGESLNRLFANFEQGVLPPFVLITSGKGADEWSVVSDINCPPNGAFCAHAGATGGSGDTIIQVNITTVNTQGMNISFNLTTFDMSVGGDFEVTIENSTTSTSLFSLVGVDLTDVTINEIIPEQWNNLTSVSINFIFSSSHPNRADVWVDTINITGNASASTLENVTRLDSFYRGGDGINTFILYNDSLKQWVFSPSNVSFQSVTEISLNVTNDITLDGQTILNWGDVSNFDLNVLLIDGSRALTNDWDFGSPTITGSGNITTTGFVGIGTTSPGAKLEVNGNIQVNQNITSLSGLVYSTNGTCNFFWSPNGLKNIEVCN